MVFDIYHRSNWNKLFKPQIHCKKSRQLPPLCLCHPHLLTGNTTPAFADRLTRFFLTFPARPDIALRYFKPQVQNQSLFWRMFGRYNLIGSDLVAPLKLITVRSLFLCFRSVLWGVAPFLIVAHLCTNDRRSGMDLEGLTVNGRYEVSRKLQAGFFGTTWLATDNRTRENVCLKVSSVQFILNG